MSKRGENIYKRKDGRWEGRFIKEYDISGKAKYGYLYAKTYTDIKEKLQIAKVSVNKDGTSKNKCISFNSISEMWMQNVSLNCKSSTLVKYGNICKNHLVPFFGNSNIYKINSIILESFLLELKKKELSNKTMQDICMVFKLIIKFAEINFNFLPNFSMKLLQIKNAQKEITTLSCEDALTLTRFLADKNDNKKIGVLICLFTGIRIGELCALKWDDISIEKGTIKISKTVQRLQQKDPDFKTSLVTTKPKSESSNRTIPLPNDILNILQTMERDDNSYFLSGSSHCIEPRVMEYSFKKYLEACNIPIVKFHVLRHTFASHCIELGFDAKTLSEILGHSSVNITLNRYVHSSFNMKKSAMNLLRL